MKETVLVTGGAGFIGSHVCDYLNVNYKVIALDDLSGGFVSNLSKKIHFVNGSVNDTHLINELFDEYQFKYVFHLAAYAAEGLSHFIRRFNYNNNLLGSVNLINASINTGSVKCFVFTSSIAVYGKNQLPMTESTIPQPEDPYGVAKYAVELDLKTAHEMFGLDYVIFRPHNVYGERQNVGDPYRNVVGIFMNQIMQNKKLTIFGDGLQTRAFSHINDVAPIIAASIDRLSCYNRIFNVGADQPYSILELAELIGQEMGVKPKIEFLPARNEVVHAWSSHDKVAKYFGDLIQGIDLENGLKSMTKWVLENGPKQGSKFENIEISKNLPPSWKKLTLSH